MKTQTAFTLIELMAVVAVIGVLTSIAIPNIRSILLNNRITSKTNEFVKAINYIRNEAIIRNNNIAIEIQPLLKKTETKPDSVNEFGNGWRVWVDLNADEERDIETDVIKEFTFSDDGIVIDEINNLTPIAYTTRGRTLDRKVYQLSICAKGYFQGRTVTVTNTGRVKTERCYLDEDSAPQCKSSC